MFSATGRRLRLQRTLGSFPQRSLGNCLWRRIRWRGRQSVLLSTRVWVSRARNTFCQRKYPCHAIIIVLCLFCWHVRNNTELYTVTSKVCEKMCSYIWMCSVRRRGQVIPNRYGAGSGQISLVHCTGSERDVTQCSHRGWGRHNCDHSQDVSISCSISSSSSSGQSQWTEYHRRCRCNASEVTATVNAGTGQSIQCRSHSRMHFLRPTARSAQRVLAIVVLFVCLFVRLGVTFRYRSKASWDI